MSGAIGAWVAFVYRNAVAVAALTMLMSAAAAVYAGSTLGVNADLTSLFPQDMPHRVLELEHAKYFPPEDEDLLILVDGASFEQARDASIVLAEGLAARSELFEKVFLPRDAFFDEHALLYMDTDELEELADRLAQVQPYVAGLARDGTLRGLVNLIERGVAAVRDGDIEGEELVPMLDAFIGSLDAALEGRTHRLSWAEAVAGRELEADDMRRFVVVRPKLDTSKFVAGEAAMAGINGVISELGLDRVEGLRVRVTGDIALSYEEMTLVKEQARTAGVASFMVVTVLLYVALGSIAMVGATVVMLLAGLACTGAFAAAVIGSVNVISIAFAVMFIGLSVDFGIHFCLHYLEILRLGVGPERAVGQTARSVGASISLCALTTAIGFYAFVPTDFSGVAELGIISGTGMFFGAAASFTVLPAFFALVKHEPSLPRSASLVAAGRALGALPARHPHAVTAVALALAATAAAVLPSVRFDHNPLKVRDPQAESVQAFAELLAGDSMSPWDLSVLAPSVEEARVIADRLSALPEVESATTVIDYVPGNQEEKLAILEDVALFLSPAGDVDGVVEAPTLGEQIEALRSLEEELEALLGERGSAGAAVVRRAGEARAALLRFFDAQASPERAASVVAIMEEGLLGSLPDRLDMLDRAVNVGPVTLDSLPSSLVDRMITPGGVARVHVRPAEDLNEDTALGRFVGAVRGTAPNVSGPAISVYEHGRAVVRAFQQALGSAVVVIALLLFVIWGTVGEAALVMAPLALASILTAATAVVVGIPFNFADIIVLPLLLGIGVDSGIHLVQRARRAEYAGATLLETSTAQAVMFSSLTTIASFGTLAFASHRGLASMGRLLAVGVAYAVLCNLVFLPALIELRARRQRSVSSD